MKEKIQDRISKSIEIKSTMLSDASLIKEIQEACLRMIKCYQGGRKILFCGNGGSAADAQHLAAELSGRFYKERPPLFAEALHVNSSFITAASNDYAFEEAYSRMVEAKAKKGDILVAISTSGNSPNILNAAKKAQDQEVTIIGLTGADGGKLARLTDIVIRIPSHDTPRIQEGHILIGHILCELIEDQLFP